MTRGNDELIELHGFTVSHYVEKARWALDYKGVPYSWRVVMIGPHLRQIRKIARKTTVPVLIDGETAIQGSAEIIDYLEARFDELVGPATRRIFYGYGLPQRKLPVYYFKQGAPAWAPAFYALSFPFLARAIGGLYETTSENVSGDEVRLGRFFEEIEARLADRSYLVGESFTRADLTLCALLSLLWEPLEHPIEWAPSELVPIGMRQWLDQHADRPLRDYVLRVYRDHRRPA
ncbi:MAG: glutathione S-transferase family protein [Acidobacteriota bacterium]|nr:glutathione S-transferase family protein [Acidobacteriota bacterium]